MKKLMACLFFSLFCFGVSSAALDNAVLAQGRVFSADGQDSIKIIFRGDTILVKNVKPLNGFPYFIHVGFPTGEHMGGGPGFCLNGNRGWNGEDDLFLELSFNKMPTNEWNFKQAVYRADKQGEAFLVCESDLVHELVTFYGENILAVHAVFDSSANVKAALTEVYSKEGLLLRSNNYPLSAGTCSIFNHFKLKQPDTLSYYFENCYNIGYAILDSGFVMLSSSLVKPAIRAPSPLKFIAQGVYYNIRGQRIPQNLKATGINFFCLPNGDVVKKISNFDRQFR
jgi:hypothetical protein